MIKIHVAYVSHLCHKNKVRTELCRFQFFCPCSRNFASILVDGALHSLQSPRGLVGEFPLVEVLKFPVVGPPLLRLG